MAKRRPPPPPPPPRDDRYAFLDSGNGERLERFGPLVVRRPAPVATWQSARVPSYWDQADLQFVRTEEGGTWTGAEKVPDPWVIDFPVGEAVLKFVAKPSPNGQVGVFPEQAGTWRWIADRIRGAGRPASVLNGFAYTGGSTLAAAQAGAEVVHVDASSSAIGWARRNAEVSGLAERAIRWIEDDVVKFLERELRRGRPYEGIILDPPSFGRGGGRNTWQFDRDLPHLLGLANEAISRAPLFVSVSCHAPEWSPDRLRNAVRSCFRNLDPYGWEAVALQASSTEPGAGPDLPLGVLARWSPEVARRERALQEPVRRDVPRYGAPRRDGPPRDRPPFDGPRRDGPPRDRHPFDGPRRDGPPSGRPPFRGPRRDGPPPRGPGRLPPRAEMPRPDAPPDEPPRAPRRDRPRTQPPAPPPSRRERPPGRSRVFRIPRKDKDV